MEILPIKSNAKDEISAWQKKKNPIVFTKIPFTCLVYGSSGVGKSTAIANIFLRDFDSLTQVFKPKQIYIFARNGRSDINFRALMIRFREIDPEWDNFSTDLDLPKIRGIIDENKKIFDQHPNERLKLSRQKLLIIDDQILEKAVHGRGSNGEIVEIAVMGRHACVSSFCLVQNITSINHVVRRNATHILAFRLNSMSERQKLFDDVAQGFLTKKTVAEIYAAAINDTMANGQPIGFLTYRPYISDPNSVFMSSFKRKITFEQG